jgi:hypothetical protein
MFAYRPRAFDPRTDPAARAGSLSVFRPAVFVPVLICGAPRELLSFAGGSSLMRRPGAYLLVRGGDEPDDLPRCNIGEGEPVGGRVNTKIENGVWEWACVVTCDQPNFTKVHAETVEMRLTACAEAAGRVVVERERAPKRRALPPGDEAAIDTMIGAIRDVLEGQGHHFLEHVDGGAAGSGTARQRSARRGAEAPVVPLHPKETGKLVHRDLFDADGRNHEESLRPTDSRAYVLRYRNLAGTAFEDRAGFHVMCGTEVAVKETNTLPEDATLRRRELLEEGILLPHPFDSSKLVFSRGHRFENGTCAAKVCAGSKQSWRTVWKERDFTSVGG